MCNCLNLYLKHDCHNPNTGVRSVGFKRVATSEIKEVAILMRTDKKIAEMTKYYCTRRKISEALFPEKS